MIGDILNEFDAPKEAKPAKTKLSTARGAAVTPKSGAAAKGQAVSPKPLAKVAEE